MKFVLPRAVYRVAAFTVTAILAGTVTARAASTDSFDALRAELLFRANSLTGSVDKVEQKQGKTCLKVIATIDKSTTFAGDIKAAAKVGKTLAKAFPSEFAPTLSLVFSNNLNVLVTGVFSNLTDEVQGDLADLQETIDALPAGSVKDAAQAALDEALAALNAGFGVDDLSALGKLLASVLKEIASIIADIEKGDDNGGGGGGGGGGAAFSCKVDGANFTPLATLCTFTSLTGELTVTGTSLQRSVTIIATGVTGPGTYPAEGGYVQEILSGVNYAGTLSGTITITTFNLAQQKASGTFSFSASQSTPTTDTNNVVNVTQGSFNVSAITQF